MRTRRRTEQVDQYLAHRDRRNELATSSRQVIRATLLQWHRHTGWTPPGGWTTREVETFVYQPGIRPNTSRSRLGKLRPYVRWLMDTGQLDHDPTKGVPAPKAPKGAPRDLPVDAVGAILHACPDQRARLIVLLMVHCGLRCGDVARIRVHDVDLARRSIHVRAKGGRGEPTHWVPVPSEAWGQLAGWLETHRPTGHLVWSYQSGGGLRPETVSRIVQRAIREAGVKGLPHDGVSPHALRHTCAQHMLDLGADLRSVQFALGHATVRSTEIYTRREPLGLRDAVDGRHYLAAA